MTAPIGSMPRGVGRSMGPVSSLFPRMDALFRQFEPSRLAISVRVFTFLLGAAVLSALALAGLQMFKPEQLMDLPAIAQNVAIWTTNLLPWVGAGLLAVCAGEWIGVAITGREPE